MHAIFKRVDKITNNIFFQPISGQDTLSKSGPLPVIPIFASTA